MLSTTYSLESIANGCLQALKIGDSDVQIWKLDLTNNYQWNSYLHLLTEEEIRKANGFKFELNKTQYLAGKIFSKLIISALLNVPVDTINFKLSTFNKPYLSGYPIHFNVSHSKDYVIVGITKLGSLGVDVEFINENFEINKLSQRFFAQEEAKRVIDSSNSDAYLSFYKCWTKKEAFIKAHGEGLSIPLSDFQVDIDAKKSTLLELDLNTESASDWVIEEIEMPPCYQAAFCLPANAHNALFFDLF